MIIIKVFKKFLTNINIFIPIYYYVTRKIKKKVYI